MDTDLCTSIHDKTCIVNVFYLDNVLKIKLRRKICKTN